ncbi:hypothetical protein GCM10028856_16830 [Halopiger thermotolerans]
MDSQPGGETATDARERSASTDRSLVGAWLASAGIAVGTLAAALGAYALTPGTPDCQLYTARMWMFCPWFRQFFGNAVAIFGAVVVVFVPCCLLAGATRALRRYLNRP